MRARFLLLQPKGGGYIAAQREFFQTAAHKQYRLVIGRARRVALLNDSLAPRLTSLPSSYEFVISYRSTSRISSSSSIREFVVWWAQLFGEVYALLFRLEGFEICSLVFDRPTGKLGSFLFSIRNALSLVN